MEKGQLLYEGKAKRIYATDEENIVWVEYKDDATAFNGEKKAQISGKGRLNNQITTLLFEKLAQAGIENHFVEKLSETEQLVKKVKIIPLEVVVRNITAGSLAKRLGKEEGIELKNAIVEFYYKNDELGDPLVNNDHISTLEIATEAELQKIKQIALKVNDILAPFFSEKNVRLVDFKLEFGVTAEGELILADEISPDTCRLWDKETNQKLDKDIFRRDLGNLTDAYEEILKRLGGTN
ncbi:phosphoribosylaminoimidazolesuccinocarboxamide synthase [Schinkia azotoformans]|uniref:phosphoribosylaminoimidazolesuccinocarboxamide synthase n=1 Tax=Schinkia azotoformans TaxID=1454 RepID=UPI002DB8F1C0|nr:phosphoribosylaminoimidazolesuccinocarboxamide synthase [Schinkia azotoformans]MEC1693848.1 phosphoribosylaminoimidazolesuccinocarboxamide synthase [Schinkia azotoformans]MEC1714659.1 phosphoribosylaminoimidazolesuccinocarboxamide synthase [Schinkia azotoformans]MEC1724807.1 phosphoribosylaminoimidazolesuccinocarboxamide synthase [Schinkia azotoformans]MEC1741166.1 phosphoribosylaminoimidazolesuccinocarboxamide synthase [Schinkia azotoformans]MEC1745255.1 phosphoribosylaminoimidazolesuccino